MESETKIRRVAMTEFLRYHFNDDEKKDLAQVMAQNVIKGRDLEEEKKAIVSQYASQINEANAKANSAAQKLASGFEMRTIDCEELWNLDAKTITIIRLDIGEEVRERTMTNRECQQDMWEEEEEAEEEVEEKDEEEATEGEG